MTKQGDHPDSENPSSKGNQDSSENPAGFDANKTVNHGQSKKTTKLFFDASSIAPEQPGVKPGRKTIQFRKGKTVDLTELERLRQEKEKTISIVKGRTVQLDGGDSGERLLDGLIPTDNRKTLEYLSTHKTIQLPDSPSNDYSGHDSFELVLPTSEEKSQNKNDSGSASNSSSQTVEFSKSTLAKTWGPMPNSNSMTSLRSLDKRESESHNPILNDRIVSWDASEPPAGNPDYRITSFLGEGAMGQVYVAKQISVDRDVAFKVQIDKPGLAKGTREQQIDKFLFEAQLTASLDHPNIVGIHDMGRDQSGQVFYCMELVRGSPWETIMADMSLESNLDVLLKVIDGVSYAHSKNTIHRDLKPENIMLGSFGEVLIMDWGLGVNLDHGPPVSMGGTPGFMAPEMARPPESATGKHSDIYVLGGILFFVITGETPHRGADVWECLDHAEKNIIVDVSGMEQKYDQGLMAVARRAMSTDPKDRYRSADDLKKAIEDSQSNRLSAKLARRSNVELSRAIKTRSYERFSKSLFGFWEALELWPENSVAAKGRKKAEHAYAECALERNDFELGMSLLDRDSEEDAALLQKLRKGANAAYRRKRLVWLAVGSSIILLAALLVTTALNARTEQIYAENLQSAVTQEAKAKVEAQIAQLKEKQERRRAEKLLAENERERARAVEEARKKWFKVFDSGNNQRVFASAKSAPVNSVEFDQSGSLVLLGISDGQLRIGKRAANGLIQGLDALGNSGSEKTEPVVHAKFANETKLILSLHDDGKLISWDRDKRTRVDSTWQDDRVISDFDVIPNDGKLFAVCDSEGKLSIVDSETGKEIQSVETKRSISAITFASKEMIAAGSDSGEILVFNPEKDKLETLQTDASEIKLIRMSSDLQVIAIVDNDEKNQGQVHCWRRFEGEWKKTCTFGQRIQSLEIAPDGRRIFTGNESGVLTVWSVSDNVPATPRKLISLHDHDRAISQISMSSDGKHLVTSSLDGSIIFWLTAENE